MNVRPKPCESCPYRKDCPSGVWHAEEYEKLIAYDGETYEQPHAVFMCHQSHRDKEPDSICAGWLHVHGDELMALRLGLMMGHIDPSVLDRLDEGTDVELFASGIEAAQHGLSQMENPDEKACILIDKLKRIKGIR